MKTKVFKSKKNSNIYEMYEDKIDVTTAVGKQIIPLPRDLVGDAICFYDIFYDSVYWRLKVVVACRKDYDVQYVIDEESLELKEKGFFK